MDMKVESKDAQHGRVSSVTLPPNSVAGLVPPNKNARKHDAEVSYSLQIEQQML